MIKTTIHYIGNHTATNSHSSFDEAWDWAKMITSKRDRLNKVTHVDITKHKLGERPTILDRVHGTSMSSELRWTLPLTSADRATLYADLSR